MTPLINGEMLLGRACVRGSGGSVRSFSTARDAELEPSFGLAELADVDRACHMAEAASDGFRRTTPSLRAGFLEIFAATLALWEAQVTERAVAETGLTHRAAKNRLDRAIEQLRVFASILRRGRHAGVPADSGMLRERVSRERSTALGPLAMFASSDIPFVYSIADVQIAAAFAAGCPVVALAQHGQFGTCEIVGRAIQASAQACGLPEGVFSMLMTQDTGVRDALVRHPLIRGVGFTGPQQECRTIMRLVMERDDCIAVFADSHALNPTVILPGALNARAEEFAVGFVTQLALEGGQRRTKSAALLVMSGAGCADLRDALIDAVERTPAQCMFLPALHERYSRWVEERMGIEGLELLALGMPPSAAWSGRAALFRLAARTLLAERRIAGHVFGPGGVLVECRDCQEVMDVVSAMPMQHAFTLHVENDDDALARQLLPVLEARAGRIAICPLASFRSAPRGAQADPRAGEQALLEFGGQESIERFMRVVRILDGPMSSRHGFAG
jgi:2,5-dioxopentanoate dehydrogenase